MIFLGDMPVAVLVGTSTHYLYTDHLDAIRVVTDATNQVRWSWENTNAFGTMLPNQNPPGLGTFNYRRDLPEQFYDAEKSTFYNGFRDYMPQIGRYLQPDPIGLAAGDYSDHTYVGQNPVTRIDP